MNFSQVKLCTAIQTKANMDTAPMAAPMAGFRLWSQSPNATTTDSVHDDHDVTNDVAVSRKDSMVRWVGVAQGALLQRWARRAG